jgi:hypothetical protein
MGVSNRSDGAKGFPLSRVSRIRSRSFCATAAALLLLAGCQGGKQIEHTRLIEHQALIDFSGLKAAETVESLKVRAAIPESWQAPTPQKTSLYTHGQWKSPSGHTAVGAVLIRLPLPLSADTIAWFAKREYSKKADDGKVLREWKDSLGRRWFEAQNNKYRVQGYCLAQGFEAWIVYFGYKTQFPPHFDELSLAARAADTFIPLTSAAAKEVERAQTATSAEKAEATGAAERAASSQP